MMKASCLGSALLPVSMCISHSFFFEIEKATTQKNKAAHLILQKKEGKKMIGENRKKHHIAATTVLLP